MQYGVFYKQSGGQYSVLECLEHVVLSTRLLTPIHVKHSIVKESVELHFFSPPVPSWILLGWILMSP